jgi:hypothetical protein
VAVVVPVTVTPAAVHQVLHACLIAAPECVAICAPISSGYAGVPVLLTVIYVGLPVVLCVLPSALDTIVIAPACHVISVFARRL